MSYCVKPALSLSLALLLCGPTAAQAGPVVDYLTEAARRTWAEEEHETLGDPAVAIPPKTVKQLFHGAESIQQKDVPAILRAYLTNTKYPNQNFWRLREADGAQVFFAQPAIGTQFKPTYLYVGGRGENGVALGRSAYDYRGRGAPALSGTTFVTLPKDTSRLWATLDGWTVRALKTTREKLRGRTSSPQNTLAHILGSTHDWLSDTNKNQTKLKAVQAIVKKSQRISATQVPSFLREYLDVFSPNPQVSLASYYVYREKDRKYYISIDMHRIFNRYIQPFICDAYDHIGLWHCDDVHSVHMLRIAAMPRGTGSSLGKRLTTKTLVALGVTRDDFGAPKASAGASKAAAAPKSGAPKTRGRAASKRVATKTPPPVQTQKKR